jgi:hypothetical protein
MTSTPSRVLLASAAALFLGALAPAAHAAPPSGPTAIVSLGDSYISGEAGRWQGNSVDPAPGNDGTDRACVPSGPACQVDKSRVYVDGTDANGCHRSDVAEVLSASVPVDKRINIACSGAVTKNIFRASSGGVGQDGERAQADQLLDVARANRVKLVVLSIGGNDLGFASIVADCFERYLSKQGPCEPVEQPKLDAAVPKARADVEKAIKEIRAVMAIDGYALGDYRLVVQTYPSVIPRASEARYSEIDPQRSNACPFYDQDLTWGRDHASLEIGQMVKDAATARGTEILELKDALAGHEFCAKTTVQNTPLDPPNPVTSEWGRFLGGSTVQEGDLQETFHPNAYAQKALGVCLSRVYASAPGDFSCSGGPGRSYDAMTFARTASVSAPTSAGGTPGASAPRRCTSRRAFALHIRRRYRGRLVSARVVIAGKRVARFRSARRAARIDLRGRPAGRVTVRIVMRLRGGVTKVDTRRYRLCAAGVHR